MAEASLRYRVSRPGFVVAVVCGIVLVMVAVVTVAVWRAVRGNLPSEAEKAEQIARLEATVLPVIEDLQVGFFMDEPGCVILTYSRGDFVSGDPEDCGGSTDSPVPFDDVAGADYERIKAALEESDTSIERVGGRFLGDGGVNDVWFMSTQGAPFATSWSLEYDPGGTQSPGRRGIVTITPVEGEHDWWFACCAD
jgi:hypothetical protein